ncbi:D-TA family PLP-dependent enzyme [Paracoccus sp. SCSIO 75233]|uniref:D-TA family PLP-dependent enzyme n=1 Tax=Paracoccus sp. SCSIO 75233 TaxID=3017782 RepID=UPI0022F0E890|nr:D-TA family PLP-dependent enzyme [Paracoccus sp. SCSIO 75233]WBU55210.1 D-TA family PLP-dependent enzyme [Paracoccus sp. SCSIO 75233]
MFEELTTPAVLVDLDVAEANIARFQDHCDRHGLKLRPHIKTHKLPMLAKQQLAAGAIGITCQKISEAEAMISEGSIDDVLITYNILGAEKLSRLRELATRVRLSVVADNAAVVAGLSQAFTDAPEPLRVLVECDTGAGRCGVATPEAAADLAALIDRQPGLHFAGLMTYPPVGRDAEVQQWLSRTRDLIEGTGLTVDVISNGGTPGMWQAQDVPVATEYRIGTYIYNDRSLEARGLCTWDDCALTVLATVVSVPAPDRAIIDAGSKVLTSDLLGLEGYGHVLGRPDIRIEALSEEHGTLKADNISLTVGERVRIVPNHACVVSNMLDQIELVRGNEYQTSAPVIARGKVW